MSFLYMRYSTLKVVLCLFFWGIIPSLYAQTTYKVTYYIAEPKIQGPTDDRLDEKSKQLIKQVEAYAKKVNFILIATQDESYFEQEDILKKENDSPLELILLEMAVDFPSFNERVYANHKEDSIIFVEKLVNQDFTVKRGRFDFNWIIKDDNKKILGFDAKKAEGNYYDPVTNKELKVEAWFIPSIPLQSGPDIFMGLPGLIVEVNLKGALVTVKKIDTNLNLDIEKVDDSKAMTQQEYKDLINRLNKKFIDN